jgi:hypothetical protein
MSASLREHVRYPEDLFRVQTTAYARYHLTDPDNFYTQEDAWRVARDPGTAGADPSTPVTDTAGQATGEQTSPRINPYYQLLQLPNTNGEADAPPGEPEMVLMRPFVPQSDDDRSQLLTAFMAARMDGDNYGELVVYQMPSGNLPPGPGIAAANIRGDEEVSQADTELGLGSSEVLYGNLLLIPIDNALLYVQPFYVVSENEARRLPQLTKVIAAFGEEVVIENTLAESLAALFGERIATQEQPGAEATPPGETPETESPAPTGTAAQQAAQLLGEADALFAEADTALTAGDLAEFQEKLDEARDKVDQAENILADARAGAGDDGDGDTTTSTTTTTAGVTTPA